MKEENQKDRYTGPATSRQSYMDQFSVACPKCQKHAIVIADTTYGSSDGILRCSHCMYSEKSLDLVRYKMVVDHACDNCGKMMDVEVLTVKQLQKEITVPCNHCGIVRTHAVKPQRYKFFYNTQKGVATDPIFNLPLWYQSPFKNHNFWAYNRQHLEDIAVYVQAKLRERQPAGFTTMVERLPQFIKEAKNREAILRIIEKLNRLG
ncbi:MAG: hypothetical protein EOO04_32665 [Chitinophagaceae bacterium]|nr:MAG: hypothetical protein EOO04_32665 [Chitinophagaceae bacterium]